MQDAILGIDVGTSATKAIVFDLAGTGSGRRQPFLSLSDAAAGLG